MIEEISLRSVWGSKTNRRSKILWSMVVFSFMALLFLDNYPTRNSSPIRPLSKHLNDQSYGVNTTTGTRFYGTLSVENYSRIRLNRSYDCWFRWRVVAWGQNVSRIYDCYSTVRIGTAKHTVEHQYGPFDINNQTELLIEFTFSPNSSDYDLSEGERLVGDVDVFLQGTENISSGPDVSWTLRIGHENFVMAIVDTHPPNGYFLNPSPYAIIVGTQKISVIAWDNETTVYRVRVRFNHGANEYRMEHQGGGLYTYLWDTAVLLNDIPWMPGQPRPYIEGPMTIEILIDDAWYNRKTLVQTVIINDHGHVYLIMGLLVIIVIGLTLFLESRNIFSQIKEHLVQGIGRYNKTVSACNRTYILYV